MVVVSHDKNFCQCIDFTHVGTVAEGKLTLEQRGTRDSDWDLFDNTKTNGDIADRNSEEAFGATNGASSSSSSSSGSARKPEVSKELRKQAYNAPKRIAKIEKLIEKEEEEIERIEAEMMTNGSDVGKLVDLTADKVKHEKNVQKLMLEWEELESVLALVG